MKNEHQEFEPLMYIEQRNERVSRPFMQQTYSSLEKESSQEEIRSEDKQKRTSKKKRKRSVHRHMHVEPIPELDDSVEIEETESDIKEAEEEQSFAELSIEEKVKYCTSTSSYIPKILCMIKTKEQAIVGTIANYEEGIVRIRTQKSRMNVETPIEDILSIRMTGF